MLYYDILPDYNTARLVRLGASKSHDSWPNWRITSFRASCGDNMDQRPKFIDACVSRHGGNDLGRVHTIRFWRHGPISLVTCAEKASIGAMDTMVMLGVDDHGGCQLCREVVNCVRAARGINHVYQYGSTGDEFVGRARFMYGITDNTKVRGRMERDDETVGLRRVHPRCQRVMSFESARSYYLSYLTNAAKGDHGIVEATYHKHVSCALFDRSTNIDTMDCRVESGVTKNSWGRTQRSRWDKSLRITLHISTVRNLVSRGLLFVGRRLIGGIVEESSRRMVAWCIKFESPAAKTHWHKAIFVKPDGPNSAWTFSGWVRGGAR